MTKLAAPFVSRSTGRSKSASVFNEGIQCTQEQWAAEVKKDPALESPIKAEKHEATKKSILTGSLAKYRRR